MPRTKTQSDEALVAIALGVVRAGGPEALTFDAVARASGLSASTLVQRFGTKAALKRAALMSAWDALDSRTQAAAQAAKRTPDGAIAMLVELSAGYGDVAQYAEGLLLLREDLRDPELRARGRSWRDALTTALDVCFAETPSAPPDVGLLLAGQWQGALLWWSFDPQGPVEHYVERSLRRFVAALVGD